MGVNSVIDDFTEWFNSQNYGFDVRVEYSTFGTNEDLYNLDRRGIEYDLLPLMRDNNLPLIAYSPLSQGDRLSGNLAANPLLKELAANHQATVYQIMLAWVIRDQHTLAIPKAASPKHARENIEALNITFSHDELAALAKAFPKPTHKEPLSVI